MNKTNPPISTNVNANRAVNIPSRYRPGMLHSPQIQSLIFDCDGTIADTMPLHYEAWVEAIEHHGHEFPKRSSMR